MGAVVVAQQHGTLFQIQGRAALQEQAGGAVAAGRNIDRAALGAGGKGRLQLAGVIGLAVGHQTVAGRIHKEALVLGAEVRGQGLALRLNGDGVVGGRGQREEGEHIGVLGLPDRFAVQQHPEGVGRTEAQAVFQLENGAAGHGADE